MIHFGHIAVIHFRRIAVIHAGHVAVIHAGMSVAHIGHAEERRLASGRDRRRHTGIGGQGGARVTGACHRLGEDGEGAGFLGADDHIVGLGDRDAELVDLHGLDIVAVGLDHGHRQSGNAHVEKGHRRGIDES